MRLPQFNSERLDPKHIGEVIETATSEYLAQCLDSEQLSFPSVPPFGSWVKAKDEESDNIIFGVVTHATTSPIDSVHRARALGLSLDQLRQQQPQIFAMLKTEFKVSLVGFETNQGQSIYQYFPPRPPQIHQAVYQCDAQEVLRFSQKLDFLRILLQVSYIPVEPLIAAVIREIYFLRASDRNWLVRVGRQLSVLLKDDYDRLSYILSQIH
ncbi:MAG: HAS-barrel domain-containing protein [Cyanobacteriota bacterium ELA615]